MAIHDNLLWLVGNVRETSDWGKAENLLGLFIYYGLQMVENLPAMQETHVRSLGWNDTVEKGMATQSSILAWRIPWTEEPGELESMGSQRIRHDWSTKTFRILLSFLDEGQEWNAGWTRGLNILVSQNPVSRKHTPSWLLHALLPMRQAWAPAWDRCLSNLGFSIRICLQCRRPGFNLWVEKIPWERKWQPSPVFLPGEFHR